MATDFKKLRKWAGENINVGDIIAAPFLLNPITAPAAGFYYAGSGYDKYLRNENDKAHADAVNAVRDSQYASAFEGLSDEALEKLLDPYRKQDSNWTNLWGLLGDGGDVVYNLDQLARDIDQLGELSDPMPIAPDHEALQKEAEDAIAAENADILAMYDADLARRTANYERDMADSNAAYNRNVGQILSNDYQKNAQLLGTLRSEMNRSQRNALEAGASAGVRIAGNINTALSLQNKMSQQSLETSNNLAQMLLNQQQANAGLRGEYNNYLSQDTARRADLKHGTAERVDAKYHSSADVADRAYNANLTNYENKFAAVSGDNPLAKHWQSNLYKSQYNPK